MPANRYAAVKWALLALLLIYAILVVGANASRNVDFAVIDAAMAQAPGLDGLKKLDENAFQERFDAAPEGLEGWLLYGADEIMNVNELLVAKGDEASLQRLEDLARGRVERQLSVFRSYGTNQAQLLDDAILLTRGSYFIYAVGDDAHLWQDALLAAIR